MKSNLLIPSQIDVFLIVNMRMFLQEDHRYNLDLEICTTRFRDALKSEHVKSKNFSIDQDFRSSLPNILDYYILENFIYARYHFNPEAQLKFNASNNFGIPVKQIKDILSKWEVYIHSTFTGFFIVHFTHKIVNQNHTLKSLTKRVEELFYTSSKDNPQNIKIPAYGYIGIEIINNFITSTRHSNLSKDNSFLMKTHPVNLNKIYYNPKTPYIVYSFKDSITNRKTDQRNSISRIITTIKNLPQLNKYYNSEKLKELTQNVQFNNNSDIYLFSPQAALLITKIGGTKKKILTNEKQISNLIIIQITLEIKRLMEYVESSIFHLIERAISDIVEVRSQLYSGVIGPFIQTPLLFKSVHNMRYILLLCKKMYRTSSWIDDKELQYKITYLFEQFDTSIMLENIEKNLSAIKEIGDHIDNLYNSDLSEQNNKIAYLGILLASTPLVLSLISLPSFWADTRELFFSFLPQFPEDLRENLMILLNLFTWIGTSLVGVILIICLFLLISIRKEIARTIGAFRLFYRKQN